MQGSYLLPNVETPCGWLLLKASIRKELNTGALASDPIVNLCKYIYKRREQKMNQYEFDPVEELTHEQEAVLALGLALDEAIDYMQDLLCILYQIYPRVILKHTPDIMQAEHFLKQWSTEDDR